MTTISFEPFKHWTQDTEFTPAKVHQREGETFITSGEAFAEETRVFPVDKHRGSGTLFPATRTITALGQDILASWFFVPYKITTAMGNLVLSCIESAQGEKFSEERVKQIGTDIVLLGATGFSWYFDLPLHTIARYASSCFLAYAIYNPKGAKYQFSKVDRLLNPAALRDGEALSLKGRRDLAVAMGTGCYTLSRILNMHCMGNMADERFENVEED